MKILIIKLGASGDVVRTTPILQKLEGEIFWLTNDYNKILLKGNTYIKEIFSWVQRDKLIGIPFDLIINLEDSLEVAYFVNKISFDKINGPRITTGNVIRYSDSSKEWFDMSLISRFSKAEADRLKLSNRKSYQEILFRILGFNYSGERYYLPSYVETNLKGDIAIAQRSGHRWPMKNWAFFNELKEYLELKNFKVNFLPRRKNLLEHIGDIQNHKYLISGDTLPMHIALGCGVKCVSLFICTSPWEIYDYGIMKKIVSPELKKYFYGCNENEEASKSISLEMVLRNIDDFIT